MKQLVITLGILCAFARPAAADDPWSQGVPEARQDEANVLFEEGVQLFAQQAHGSALEKYRAAITIWDHPLIRFNIAVALIRLDRPLEAADELEKALRYGEQPFKKELYQQALDYQALLKGRVGYIEATCEQPGATVLLDGKPWFSCPGTQKIRVMAGEHALVGEQSNFLTSSQRLVVVGGSTEKQVVKLVPLESAVILKYPYRRWIPYTVSAAGAAIGLGGLAVWLSGRSQMSDFEDNFARECPMGCDQALAGDDYALLREQRDGAEFKGTVGISMMVAGGAITIGGVVMAILNRPERILPKVEVAPTQGGMTARATFRF